VTSTSSASTGRPAPGPWARRHGRIASLDDIKNFRQLDSVTPGHPEYGRTTGVETTTGPLGQDCGNSVGMAIASRWLAARFCISPACAAALAMIEIKHRRAWPIVATFTPFAATAI